MECSKGVEKRKDVIALDSYTGRRLGKGEAENPHYSHQKKSIVGVMNQEFLRKERGKVKRPKAFHCFWEDGCFI